MVMGEMNILLLAHSGSVGSTGNHLVKLAEGVKDLGIVYCVSPNPGRGIWKAMDDIGVHMHYMQKLDEIIANSKIDIIISNTITQTAGVEITNRQGIPHIWWVHEILSQDPELQVSIDLYDTYELLKKSGKIVAVSQAVKKDLQEHGCSDVEVIYDFVNCNGAPNRKPGINRILNISNIAERKDISTFVKTMAEVAKAHADIQSDVYGLISNMPYYYETQKLRKSLGLTQSQCGVRGFRADTRPVDRDADLLVHTAKCEPFGMGIIEAMSVGLPVIATRSGGPEESIVEGETGFMCDVGDYKGIADKILYLKDNPEIGIKMGLSGYERAKKEFTYSKFIASWRDVIQRSV